MQKRLLYEISVIRPLVIFLLVVYHSLCVYTGGWTVPDGVTDNAAYWWLGNLISGFRIETIAFVGGYVFAYQCVELNKRQRFFAFVWKKFKRLIIPCFVFGIPYYLLFRFHPDRFSFNIAFWKIANGVGHLWFLPMLFWCFLINWAIDQLLHWTKKKHQTYYKWVGWGILLALAAASLLRITGLRLGVSRVPNFAFYFYLGYWLRIQLAEPSAKRNSWASWALVLTIAYLVLLVIKLQCTKWQLPGMGFSIPKGLQGWSSISIRLLKLGHTTCGILALFCWVWYGLYCSPWAEKKKAERPTEDPQPSIGLREASRLCYGTYIFHMFFMEWIYYYTPLPKLLSPTAWSTALLPWIVLIATLALSIPLTSLVLKTKTGRLLIG